MQIQHRIRPARGSRLRTLCLVIIATATPGQVLAADGDPVGQPAAVAEPAVEAPPTPAPALDAVPVPLPEPVVEAPPAPKPVQPRPIVVAVPAKAAVPAKPLGIEITIGPEAQGLTASRMGRVSGVDTLGAVFFRVSYNLMNRLGVYAGWRGIPPFGLYRNNYSTETSAYGGVVGLRWLEPLSSWLSAAFELDLELLYGGTTLDLNGRKGQDGSLAFGTVPKLGLSAHTSFSETVDFHFRLMFGYALRTSHSVDSLKLDLDHPGTTEALNLGTLNFSGPVFALSFGVSF